MIDARTRRGTLGVEAIETLLGALQPYKLL